MNAVLLDCETHALDNPEPIEIAWTELSPPPKPEGVDSGYHRFKPSKPITWGAMATHHITNADVEDCPHSSLWTLKPGIAYIIGHNIDFDWCAIGQPDVKRICTLALSRSLWPKTDSHKLAAMGYMLGINRELLNGVHGAREDVAICRLLLGVILSFLPAVSSWEDLWLASEAARVPTVMPFGKHRGVPIADVPGDYKRWLLGQTDLDAYIRKALGG